LKYSIININYCIITNVYYNYVISAAYNYYIPNNGFLEECDKELNVAVTVLLLLPVAKEDC